MLTIYHRVGKDDSLTELQEVRRNSWIHAVNPTREEMEKLEALGIIIENIEDALDPDEQPRQEHKDGINYFILNAPVVDDGRLVTAPILIVVAQDFFLTLSRASFDFINARLKNPDMFTHQKTRNFIEIAINIIDQFTICIRRINKTVSSKRTNLTNLTNTDITSLVENEETLNKFDSCLVPQIGMFERVMSGRTITVFQEDKELTEDLIIDARQCLNMCETSIRMIVNIREAYTAILTNNLNKVIRFLTSLTVVLAVPTIVASVFGMNVQVPWAEHDLGFVFALLVMVLMIVCVAVFFYFKKWL